MVNLGDRAIAIKGKAVAQGKVRGTDVKDDLAESGHARWSTSLSDLLLKVLRSPGSLTSTRAHVQS